MEINAALIVNVNALGKSEQSLIDKGRLRWLLTSPCSHRKRKDNFIQTQQLVCPIGCPISDL